MDVAGDLRHLKLDADELLRRLRGNLSGWQAQLRTWGFLWAQEDRPLPELLDQGIRAWQALEEVPAPLEEALKVLAAGYEEGRTQRRQELRARLEELDALHRIMRAANSRLDLTAALQLIVETIPRVLPVDVCSIFLYEEEENRLVLAATRGLNPEMVGRIRVPLGKGIVGTAALQGQPIAAPDAHQDPRFVFVPNLGEEQYRSMLAVPIILFAGQQQLMGVLSVRTRQRREFSPREIAFLETVAGELAFALHNARRFQWTDARLRRKVQELSLLQELSAAVAATLDEQEVLELVVEKGGELVGAEGTLLVRFRGGGVWEIAAARGVDPHLLWQAWRRLSTADWPRVSPVQVGDLRAEGRRYPLLERLADLGFRSALLIPLRSRREALGVLIVLTRRRHHFDEEEVGLLRAFAAEAVVALENAHLYEEVRRALHLKTILLQELHHRVRNNLQTVAALLAMEARRREDPEVVRVLRESEARVRSIAVVHDLLSGEDFGHTSLPLLARRIWNAVARGLLPPETRVRFQVEGEPLSLTSREATLLALILTELYTNALRHGLAGRQEGEVRVVCRLEEDRRCLEVWNPVPADAPAPDLAGRGLGQQIVRALGEGELGGTFVLERSDSWTVARLCFPVRREGEEGAASG